MELELSISTSYVPSWGLVEATRELFQNCLDKQITDPENKMICEYDVETKTLRIGNRLSVLTRNTLLLGESTKRDDTRTIGQHGEGYKLALLVLARNNYKVQILNFATRELWTPKLKYSKVYGSDVLAINIKKYIFQSVPDNNLVFEINWISADEYEKIKDSNLHLQDLSREEILVSPKGRVLLDESRKGKIYVNGLYVTTTDLTHGYDFRPGVLQLDRDRALVRDFDLQWATGNIWKDLSVDHHEKVLDLSTTNSKDVQYINNHVSSNDIRDRALARFTKDYGVSSVPVISESDLRVAKSKGLRPIIVPSSYKELIVSSKLYNPAKVPTSQLKSPKEHLVELYDAMFRNDELSEHNGAEFEKIIKLSEEWVWKKDA